MAGFSREVPLKSASSACSVTFICEVLTVTVTWSGTGSSSASMWRVSSDSHLAAAPSVSGAKLIDPPTWMRSEEHTSELQSLAYLVCRLLLEKKKQKVHQS